MSKFFFGIDHLLQTPHQSLKQFRWGLVTNDAARTIDGTYSRMALLENGWLLDCLFSPEHGLSAQGIDGEAQPNKVDAVSGLPVWSLYGPNFGPKLDSIKSIDGVLFDLPDSGVRFYTYLWTLSYTMEACEASGKPLIILDRPNPISGNLTISEGPMLDEKDLSSFIGRWSIPIRHGLSFGEIAQYWKSERGMRNLELIVIPCINWKRHQYLMDLDVPFFPPSPALGSPATLLTYPALCFMEGVNLNEGRGSVLPFQQFGAPWLDNTSFVEVLNDQQFPGVHFSEVNYIPIEGRYKDVVCKGIKLDVVDRQNYQPITTGLGIIALLKIYFKDQIQWAPYPTHANPSGNNHIKLLIGDALTFNLLENEPRKFLKQLNSITSVPKWQQKVHQALLYE